MLERLAQELLEHESLDGQAVYAIIQEMTGKDLNPDSSGARVTRDPTRR